MFELLDVGGCMMILESGNPMGSHTTRTARQFILDVFNNVDENGRFHAGAKYPVDEEVKIEGDDEGGVVDIRPKFGKMKNVSIERDQAQR
jgi:ribosomal protein RSM22 (predicted rRNA methylase)